MLSSVPDPGVVLSLSHSHSHSHSHNYDQLTKEDKQLIQDNDIEEQEGQIEENTVDIPTNNNDQHDHQYSLHGPIADESIHHLHHHHEKSGLRHHRHHSNSNSNSSSNKNNAESGDTPHHQREIELSALVEEGYKEKDKERDSTFFDYMDSFVGSTQDGIGTTGHPHHPHPHHQQHTTATTFRFVCLVLGPLLMLPFLFNPLDADPRINRCAGVTIWMAVWWMSEALPISFTSLLPLVLFPLLGVIQPDTVAEAYFNDLSFLFIGTVIFGQAMERWNFHKRFALKILTIVGTNPSAVLLGFMTCTYLLSWWLSNSATAALMLPVVRAVLDSLSEDSNPQESHRFSKAALIAVAYASSIGGISTLTGTGTNLVFAGQVSDMFPKYEGISFAQWMLYAVPLSLFLMATLWVLFYFQYVRHSTHRISTHSVQQRYNMLGPISFEEVIVTILLASTIVLWLLREPPGCASCGWQAMFSPYISWYGGSPELVSDTTVVLFTSFLMFVIPAKNKAVARRILEWDMVLKKLPWDVLLLLGGGFALSDSFSATGFTGFIAHHLGALASMPPYLLVLLISATVTFLTEFTSNAAVASVMLPIVGSMAVAMRVNPLFLMVPTTISCSFAFCLPVATPSNAMVFGTGAVTIGDLVRSGVVMNVVGVLLNVAWMWAAGPILAIHRGQFPAWADPTPQQ